MSILSKTAPPPSSLHARLLELERASLPPQLRLELEVSLGQFVPVGDLTVAETEALCLVLYGPVDGGCRGIVCSPEGFASSVRVSHRPEVQPSAATQYVDHRGRTIEGDPEDRHDPYE